MRCQVERASVDDLVWGTHNSLLLVTFDESGPSGGSNRIVTLLGGAGLRPGRVGEPVDHYGLLQTVEPMYGLPALGRAADATRSVWAGG